MRPSTARNRRQRMLFKVAETLQANNAGLEITLQPGQPTRIGPPQPRPVSGIQPSPHDVHTRLQRDFAWLLTYLQTDAGDTLSGNYVAVYNQQVTCRGPTADTARQGAAEKLGVPAGHILVVPYRVPGSDEEWENIQNELGLEIA